MESNRVNKNQLPERIITKRLVSDNLLSLINLGVGLKKKLIREIERNVFPGYYPNNPVMPEIEENKNLFTSPPINGPASVTPR